MSQSTMCTELLTHKRMWYYKRIRTSLYLLGWTIWKWHILVDWNYGTSEEILIFRWNSCAKTSLVIKTSTHLAVYSPFWALASSFILVFSRICDVSVRRTSSQLVLGFPTCLVLWNFSLRNFFEILSPTILMIWPDRPSLLIWISSTLFRSLYKL